MYIKIKNIKKILLVTACIFFAGFNYMTYVKADSATDASTCDKAVDSDCDGLTNTEEKLYGTAADRADTDGDGYSDGVEVKSGYDPTKPAPGDKITSTAYSSNSSDQTIQVETASLTTSFTQDFKKFINEKGAQSISTNDVNNFIEAKLADKIGASITIDSLPEVDSSSIKILDQTYASLTTDQRKQKLQEDSSKYFTTLIYLLLSNSPVTISNSEDLSAFNSSFLNHVNSLSSTTPDYEYFSEFGDRLTLLLDQLSDIEVPETMLSMHIKMLRITKGFLYLKGTVDYNNDPISRMALLSKIQALTALGTDFLRTDVANYLKQF